MIEYVWCSSDELNFGIEIDVRIYEQKKCIFNLSSARGLNPNKRLNLFAIYTADRAKNSPYGGLPVALFWLDRSYTNKFKFIF